MNSVMIPPGNGPLVGLWMYQNGGGENVERKLVSRLQERGARVITGLNLAQSIAGQGEILCQGFPVETLDLFLSYNAGEQTPFQVYLYETLNRSVTCINSWEAFNLTEDKFLTAHALHRAGVRTTDYRLCHREDIDGLKRTIREWDGKVVYKPVHGWGGTGIFKIEDERQIDVLMPFIHRLDMPHFYLERFINYDKTDYRIDIVDGQFVGCYGRKAPDDDWKTNITSGGSVIAREANDAVIEVAIRAAEVVGADIAGVDLIYDLDAEEYVVLEVNGIPAFATPEQEAMGIDFNERKIAVLTDLIARKIGVA